MDMDMYLQGGQESEMEGGMSLWKKRASASWLWKDPKDIN